MKKIVFALFLVFLFNESFGQLQLSSFTPSRYALHVANDATIEAVFNVSIDNASLNHANAQVYGSQTGYYTEGNWTGGGTNKISFKPTRPFKKGETITVSFTQNLRGTGGQTLSSPIQYQFTARASVAQAFFSKQMSLAVGAGPQGVYSADIDKDGDVDVVSANFNGNNISVAKNNGNGVLTNNTNYVANTKSMFSYVADIDRDGDMDVLSANSAAQNISVFKNNGDGTFAAKVEYATQSSPVSIYVSDLDGDGDLDIALACYGANFSTNHQLAIFKNNGNGTFAPRVDYPALGSPFCVFGADIDKDGDIDLATSNSLGNSISIYRNNGNGTFAAKVDYLTNTDPRSVYFNDFDADGDADLAVCNYGSSTLSIFTNKGDGTFNTKVDYTIGTGIWSVFGVDADGDGDIDLVGSNTNQSSVSLLKNNGNATFGAVSNFAAEGYTIYTSPLDSDGDGDMDLAVANHVANTVSILKNIIPITVRQNTTTIPHSTGTHNFGTLSTNATHTQTFTVVNPDPTFTVDVSSIQISGGSGNSAFKVINISKSQIAPNGTITFDLTFSASNAGTYSAFITINNTSYPAQYAFTVSATASSTTTPSLPSLQLSSFTPNRHALHVANDATIEAVFNVSIDNASLNHTNAQVYGSQTGYYTEGTWTGGGTNKISFKPTRPFKKGETITVSFTKNLRGTGGAVLANPFQYQFTAKADASGIVFASAVRYMGGSSHTGLANADLDKDGDTDVVVSNYWGNTISTFKNNGNGIFGSAVNNTTSSQPHSIGTGDFDRDGDMDVVVGNNASAVISLFKNNGDGTFATQATFPAVGGTLTPYIGDMDGDSDLDLAVADNNGISIYKNNGDATFSTPTAYRTVECYTIYGGDMDNDGDIDLVSTNRHTSSISIRFNNGTGSFSTNTNYTVGANPYGIHLADIDADQDIDLVVSSYSSNLVSIFKNNGSGIFGSKTDYNITAPYNIKTADIDGDRDMDLIVSIYLTPGKVAVLKNKGDGSYDNAQNYAVHSGSYSMEQSDMDGDGDIDLVAGNTDNNSISFLRNIIPITVRQNTTTIPHSTGTHNFGTLSTNATHTRTFTVVNPDPTFTVDVSSIQISGGSGSSAFKAINISKSQIAPNGTITFDLTFSASTAGTYSAFITINNTSYPAQYAFTVSATASTNVVVTPPIASNLTLKLKATAIDKDTIALAWQGNFKANNYTLYRKKGGEKEDKFAVLKNNLKDSTWTDTDRLQPDTEYVYYVEGFTATQRAISNRDSTFTYPKLAEAFLLKKGCENTQGAVLQAKNGTLYYWYATEKSTTPITVGSLVVQDSIWRTPIFKNDTTLYVTVKGKKYESKKKTAIRVLVKPLPTAKIQGTAKQSFCEATGTLKAEILTDPTTVYEWYYNGTLIGTGTELKVSKSGDYRLVVRQEDCISQNVAVVTVETLITESREKIAFCNSGTLIAADQASTTTHEWQKQGIVLGRSATLTVTESGIYELISRNGFCQNRKIFEVTVSKIEKVVLTADKTQICPQENAVLKASTSPNAQYEWLHNGKLLAEKTATLSTNEAGEYQVRRIETSTCQTLSEVLIISKLVSVQPKLLSQKTEKKQSSTFKVYPNPSRSVFFIDFWGDWVESQTELTFESTAQNLEIQWFVNDQVLPQFQNQSRISPTQTGKYKVRVKTEKGCWENSNEWEYKENTTTNIKPVKIALINVVGQIVATYERTLNNSKTLQLTIPDLYPGVFLLRVTVGSEEKLHKVLIMR